MSNRECPILPLYWTDDPFIADQLLENEWQESVAAQHAEESGFPIESDGATPKESY